MVCLVICFQLVIPMQSVAESRLPDGLFFNYSSSKKLVTDIKFYNENYPKLEEKYDICTKQVSTANKNIDATEKLLNGCNGDKVVLKGISADLEAKYVKAGNDLIDCGNAKPSRFTWFSIGAVTTMVAMLVLMFKK